MSLAGKVFLITGAVSGIGAGTARHLSELGAKLALIDLNPTQLTETVDDISKSGTFKPFPIVGDVTTDAERIIKETIKHFGRLDVLVNNAGIGYPDSIVDFDADQYDRIMNVNIRLC